MTSFRKVTFRPFQSDEENLNQIGGSTAMAPPMVTNAEPSAVSDVSQQDVEMEAHPKKGNFIKERAVERQRKLLRIALKLASVQGYNDLDHIRLEDGTFMTGSDIISLLLYALSPGKLINGLKEFVDLLFAANVTPDLVTNETVKAMLQKLYNNRANAAQPRPQPQFLPRPTQPKPILKRKIEEPEDDQGVEEPPPKRPMLRKVFKRKQDSDNDEWEVKDVMGEAMKASKKMNWDNADSDFDDE